MVEHPTPAPNELPAELQRQLQFEYTPSKEWLFSDEMTQVGGIEHGGEWLPARTRISMDGSRFEVGARIQDVEGLLELNKLEKSTVQTVDTVINFWQNNPKFGTTVEDIWVYIGTDIEPTVEGMETEYSSVSFAYDVALESAISGKNYEELAQDERWYGSLLKQIQERDSSGRTILFNRESREETVLDFTQIREGATCELSPFITADNLREYPLATNRTSLHGLPGTMITADGKTREINHAWVIAYNVEPGVKILDSKSDFDWEKKEWSHERTNVTLPIPDGVEIKTVADLVMLNKTKVSLSDDTSEESMEVDVNVVVEDNSFRIVAQDPENPFSLEIRNSQCTDCELPYWKFRDPTPEEAEEDRNPYKEFGMHSISIGGARGNYECHIDTPDGNKLYCFDCVQKVEAGYLEENPTAKKSTAMEIAKGKLADAGYPDVQIWDTQVWRTEQDGQDGWEIFTYIEYERDGKTIMRHTGIPKLKDNGEFELNMKPREYIDFRYKPSLNSLPETIFE
jgi:hypothetical protein